MRGGAYFQGRYEEGIPLGEEGLAISRELNDPLRIREALQVCTINTSGGSDYRAARVYGQELFELAKESGDEDTIATASTSYAEILRADGDVDAAEPLYEVSLSISQKRGDRQNEVVALMNLCSIAVAHGDITRTRELLTKAVSGEGIMAVRNSAVVVNAAGNWCATSEMWNQAARFYGAAQTIFGRVGYELEPVDKKVKEPLIARTREALGESAFQAVFAEGSALSKEEAMAELRSCLKAP